MKHTIAGMKVTVNPRVPPDEIWVAQEERVVAVLKQTDAGYQCLEGDNEMLRLMEIDFNGGAMP